VLLCAGCGGSSTGGDDEDRIVEGVNLTELFSEPTASEREQVLNDWSSRTHAAAGINPVSQNAISLGGTAATVRIISHSVGDATHFGAIVSPDNAAAASLPLVVYLHGGDDGVDVSELLSVLPIALASAQDDYVYLVPSFRAEELRYNAVTHTSTGDASPWDRDVDDVLSLIDAAISVTPAIDSDRIGVVGFSRGACVAMLAGIRDDRIDLVIEFFGPTDFFSDWTEDIFADALDGTLRDLPGLSTLNTTVIQPLKAGTKSYAEVRLEMLRRSPVYFVDLLPPTQGHHGTLDNVVPVSQANLLKAAFVAEGLPATDHTVYIYNGGTHNPITLLGSFERARGFLERLSNPAAGIASITTLDE
jgi:dipeptidyl aminopeptidase/acylaminoacyl peptidase